MSVDIGSWRCERTRPGQAPALRLPQLQLLGPLSAIGEQSGLQLVYRKGWAVLAYLLVEQGRNHRRTELSALLWPRLSETAALTNLRQVLCDLKRKLTPCWARDNCRWSVSGCACAWIRQIRSVTCSRSKPWWSIARWRPTPDKWAGCWNAASCWRGGRPMAARSSTSG